MRDVRAESRFFLQMVKRALTHFLEGSNCGFALLAHYSLGKMQDDLGKTKQDGNILIDSCNLNQYLTLFDMNSWTSHTAVSVLGLMHDANVSPDPVNIRI